MGLACSGHHPVIDRGSWSGVAGWKMVAVVVNIVFVDIVWSSDLASASNDCNLS